MGASTTVAELRARIAAIEGGPNRVERRLTGVIALDQGLGGVQVPGLVSLQGELGQGGTRLVASVLAIQTQQDRLVAWVDAARTLYPPALAALGVDLSRLLIVQPPAGHEVWAAEQILRSGCFPMVAISGIERPGRAAQRWARAVEHGGGVGWVLMQGDARDVPAALRLKVADRLVVLRDRGGVAGREIFSPVLQGA